MPQKIGGSVSVRALIEGKVFMAIPHAQSGQVIDIRPLGSALTSSQTTTLMKTDSLEVIRLVLPAGKDLEQHKVPGEITLQCLEGKVRFNAGNSTGILESGSLVFLRGSEEHSLHAKEDSSLLLTIQLRPARL